MTKLFAKFQAYTTNEEGATAIEYGLIAAGISIGIVAVVFIFGDELEAVFTELNTEMQAR